MKRIQTKSMKAVSVVLFLCIIVTSLTLVGCVNNDSSLGTAPTISGSQNGTETIKGNSATESSSKEEASQSVVYLSDVSGRIDFFESGHPVPGDIIKEYTWSGPYRNAAKWQRVTDPDATRESAVRFLPNPINKIVIDDLKGVEKVEMIIEMWGGHNGTHSKKVKINGNDWIDIKEPESLGSDPQFYMKYTYPVVSIPMEQLVEGENTFEFTCKSNAWGQWAFTGLVFRAYYYKQDGESMVTGNVVLPKDGRAEGEEVTLAVDLSDSSKVKKVEYIGFYEDFDCDSDAIYNEWQFNYRFGNISSHIGTSDVAPFSVTWDTTWVPDQEKPILILARITDVNDIITITPAVDGLTLDRKDRSVKLYKPYDVPKDFGVRANNKKRCKVDVPDLTGMKEARMVLATWAGSHHGEFFINDKLITDNIGFSHDISYDEIPIPLELILEGTNEYMVFSATKEHDVEIMWPGIGMKVLYEK